MRDGVRHKRDVVECVWLRVWRGEVVADTADYEAEADEYERRQDPCLFWG